MAYLLKSEGPATEQTKASSTKKTEGDSYWTWIGTKTEMQGGLQTTAYVLGKLSQYLACFRFDLFLMSRYNVFMAGAGLFRKFEYYANAPYKVLRNGEVKADLKKTSAVSTRTAWTALGLFSTAEKHEELVKETDTNKATQKQKILDDQLTALTRKITTSDYQLESSGYVAIKAAAGSSQINMSPLGIGMSGAGGAAKISINPAGIVTHQGVLVKLG